MHPARPHLLGIDDAPFDKRQAHEVPIVGVMMEGPDLIEGVAIDAFPVDGAGATDYLAAWVSGLRWHASLQAVVLGGVTIAGLGLVDLAALAERLGRPVLAVTRRDTSASALTGALRAAGLTDRLPILERLPPARRLDDGLYVACAGTDFAHAARLVRASLHKSSLPEPLRVAHLIGAALVRGASRGRV
ncbi:endonuclease dU [Rhodocaloribacter sp.]